MKLEGLIDMTPEERRLNRDKDSAAREAGRPRLKRFSDSALASKAYRIFHDPDFNHFFDTVQAQYLSGLENVELDGSAQSNQNAVIALAKYQALMDIRRAVFEPIAKAQRQEVRDQQREDRPDEKRPRRAPKN